MAHDPKHLPALPRPARRGLLAVHVIVSVGWLGVSLCLLTLAVAGARDPAVWARPAYAAMSLFADWLLTPVSLLSLGTGLVLSLGTPWGLARHRWVWTKFWLTLAATCATLLAFAPAADEAAALAAAGAPVPSSQLLFPPAVSLSLYSFLTVISVLKPWGLTRRGRLLRAARRRPAAPGTDRPLAPRSAAERPAAERESSGTEAAPAGR